MGHTWHQPPIPADAYGPHPYVADDLGACIGCGHPQDAVCHPDDPWDLAAVPAQRSRSAAATR